MGKSRGAKIITKKVSSANDEDMKDLHTMFSQITGSSDPERDVILPKIENIYRNIIQYNTLYNVLLNFKIFTDQFSDYDFWFSDIKTFLDKLIETTGVDITKKYDVFNVHEHTYYKLSDIELVKFYKNLKDNVCVKKIVITGSNLSVHKVHISNVDKLDDVFINREPGLVLQPLAFTTLDLKTIWQFANISDAAKKFILSILRHTYLIGIDTYDIITSPDVDIKKFSKLLVDRLAEMKKMIPRCNNAFAIIENSVQMLEDNFKTYFRGSVEAENSSIIFESFLGDLVTSQKASPKVTAEFGKIIAFLKQQSAQNKDPKVKKLLSMLNNQFKMEETELSAGFEPEPETKTEAKTETKTETKIEPLLTLVEQQLDSAKI